MDVLAYIESHRDEDLSLDELCRAAGISKFHFHRIFRGYMGVSLGEYVKLRRLEGGMWNLIHSDLKTSDIALEAGYQSHAAFSRAFKKEIGCSPEDLEFDTRNRSESLRQDYSEMPRAFQGTAMIDAIDVLYVRRKAATSRQRKSPGRI